MTMIDPDNIKTDAQATLDLPRVITADDYHEFGYLENFLHQDLGLKDVRITEVGFNAPMYVGVVHLNTPTHNQMVRELESHYEQLEEME